MSHRILVVEDDAAIMANTLRVLRLEGFEATAPVMALKRYSASNCRSLT